MTRRPVGVSTHAAHEDAPSCIVVCDDGSVWSALEFGSPDWAELPPIPGTARDREMRDLDDPPGGAR